jgi:hypothetical protein
MLSTVRLRASSDVSMQASAGAVAGADPAARVEASSACAEARSAAACP